MNKQMKIIRVLIAAAVALFMSVSFAYDWSGKTGVVELTETAEVTDADVGTVAALDGIRLVGETTKLVFKNTTALTLSGYVVGDGQIVKDGTGDVTLATVADSGQPLVNNWCGDNYTTGGIAVNAGNLYLPQEGNKECWYGPVTVAGGATLYVQPDKRMGVDSLNGAGRFVSVKANTTSDDKPDMRLGRYGSDLVSDFTGTIEGNVSVLAAGKVILSNTQSSFGGQVSVQHAGKRSGTGESGCLYTPSFGVRQTGSPIGLGNKWNYANAIDIQLDYGGKIRYVGSGETTDKRIRLGSSYDYGTGPVEIDGGENGGVTFEGTWNNYTPDKMGGIVLTGSNTADMVLANAIDCVRNGQAFFQIKKAGTGSWRLRDHASRSGYVGAWFVEDGTLKYDSIADIGENCSLGLSTSCVPFSYGNAWSAGYVADNRLPYEIQLGSASAIPMFAFVGSGDFASNRRIGLAGRGARISADAPEGSLSLTGGVVVIEGESEAANLILCGSGARKAEIANVAPGINITKEGTGTWRLACPAAPAGDIDVKSGTLTLPSRNVIPYTWYRFTITQMNNANDSGRSQYFWLTQLGLFDAKGNNVIATPMTFVGSGSSSMHTYEEGGYDPSALRPGQVTLGAYRNKLCFNGAANLPSALFADSKTSYLRGAFDGAAEDGKTAHTLPIVFRLPEGAEPPRYFDVLQRIDHTANNHLACFQLEGSADGEEWHMLYHETECKCRAAYEWNSTGVAWSEGQNCLSEGAVFGYPIACGTEDNPEVVDLSAAKSVRVVRGAVLETVPVGGTTLPKLTVDCADGSGTIGGFILAETGVLTLENVPRSVNQDLAIDFVDCTGVENLANWSVFVGGKDKSGCYEVTVSDDGVVHVASKGIVLIVR